MSREAAGMGAPAAGSSGATGAIGRVAVAAGSSEAT
jgi:hypothetical protein